MLALLAGTGAASAFGAGAPLDDEATVTAPAPLDTDAVSQQDPFDPWARERTDDPIAALEALDRIEPTATAGDTDRRRQWLFLRGRLQALREPELALATARALRQMAGETGDVLALPAADLVEAEIAQAADRFEQISELAHRALPDLVAACELASPHPDWTVLDEATPSLPGREPLPAGCDTLLAWQALDLLDTSETARGAPLMAIRYLRMARDLALRAQDDWRYAQFTALLGQRLAAIGQREAGQARLREALARPVAQHDPLLNGSILMLQSAVARLDGRLGLARSLVRRSVERGRQAGSRRLEAVALNNLADIEAHSNRPQQALRAIERALPIARHIGDRKLELALLHNATLARIGLGRIADTHDDIERLVQIERDAGRSADAAESLREFGEALAAAGATTEALALYHRERAITAELVAFDRRTALEALRESNDAVRKQREIELLGRDTELKSQALINESLRQRAAVLVTVLVALVGAVAVTIAWRLRQAQRGLVASQARLRVLSERDPLTLLANRRHFLAAMQQRSDRDPFIGALLLIDIDHFKQVNDRLGHAAGDAVLVEVARRLIEAVRAEDLVVRWGGEEFLVLARDVSGPRLQALARRILQSLGASPVPTSADALPERTGIQRLRQEGPLNVSASIGYARFPLAGPMQSSGWETAVRLVDRALSLAKRWGRNRAVGVTRFDTLEAESLLQNPADFDRAVADGRIGVEIETGPPAPTTEAQEPATSMPIESSRGVA